MTNHSVQHSQHKKPKLIVYNKGKNIEESKKMSYSKLSKELTSHIDKDEKKKNGIFFTPPKTIYENITYLKPYMKNIHTILEPSCGSCEYILKLKEMYSDMNITGIERNKTIYDSIKQYNSHNTTIIHDDYLSHTFDNTFDLIIGNPPYFVMKKSDVKECYYDYFDGRPNIFILFIIKSLRLLQSNGIMSFVLPKNFLNCLYYDKTRKHIFINYSIIDIIECNDSYIDTQQDTIILIIQNVKPVDNDAFNIHISDYTIFGTKENITMLKTLYKHSTTLFDLGFNVSVGNVVWNQCKSILTDNSKETRLIYSSDITNNTLSMKSYSNKAKKNYIKKEGNNIPLLVINRGYGMGAYDFNYCIINEHDNIYYLIENHLICIKYCKSLSKKELIKKYKQIIHSFKNEKTKDFIRMYFGNNAINTTELCKILPIYDYY